MQKQYVVASDGSVHFYPEGFIIEWYTGQPGVLMVSTENRVVVAMFYRPVRVSLE